MLVSSVPLSLTTIAGLPRGGDEAVELASDAQAGERGIGDQRQALAGEVVDDGENAEAPTVGESVGEEVEAPALIGSLRQCQRRPGSERPLSATATANLEPFIAIQPAELLVVHADALTSQENMETPITEAPAGGCQIAQAGSYGGIVRSGAAVADRASIGAQHRTRPPFAHLERYLEMSDGLAPRDGRHHFFELMSLSMALSSIASASSFFSLAFSSSSAFSRRASETSRPPYLPFHLMGWTALSPSPQADRHQESHMTIETLGIDIAKNAFQLHGVNRAGRVVLKHRVMRDQLLEVLAQIDPCTVVVEACTGAFYWARKFEALGHR